MLKRVVLENFKSLKYLDFECAQLNLLTGLNGSGKSSFIQFLNFLRSYAKKGISLELICTCKELGLPGKYQDIRYCYAREDDLVSFCVDFEAKRNSVYCEELAQGGSLNRIISLEYDSVDAANVLIADAEVYALTKKWHADNSENILGRIASLFNKKQTTITRLNEEQTTDTHQKSLWEVRQSWHSREELKMFAFENLWKNARVVVASRGQPPEVQSGSGKYGSEKDATIFNDVSFDPEGADVVEYIYKFGRVCTLDQDNPMIFPGSELHENDEDIDDEERGRRKKCSTLFEQVNAWLSVISPGAHLDISREVGGDEEVYCEKVVFGKNEYAKSFRPQNVGFGISVVLPVLATVLTARPTDIIIIENPEAHLHPNGQSAIGKLLARAAAYGVQLFVETHSDHVINGIRVAVKQGILKANDVNIAFFDRRKHKVRYDEGVREEYYSDIHEIKVDKNGMLSNYPKGFLDEWDNQYYQLIR